MDDNSDPIRERFIHQVGEFASSMGLNRSVGQLYALLYMSREPMCLDDLAGAGDMSKANASINMRELERWNAVRRVWVRGDRKDYYEANRDLPQIVISRLQDGLGRRLRGLEDVVAEATERVEQMEGDADDKRFYRERLADVDKLQGSLRRLLGNMDKVYGVVKRFL